MNHVNFHEQMFKLFQSARELDEHLTLYDNAGSKHDLHDIIKYSKDVLDAATELQDWHR